MPSIFSSYRKLFPGRNFELFKYFLNYCSYYTGFDTITSFEELRKLVIAISCIEPLDGTRICEIISDIELEYGENTAVFDLFKIICCSALPMGKSCENKIEAPCTPENTVRNLYESVLAFDCSYIRDLRIEYHYQPSTQALQPVPDDLLRNLKDEEVAAIQTRFSSPKQHFQEDIAFADIMAVAECCCKLSCLPRDREMLSAIEEVEFSAIGSPKFCFLKQLVESRLVEFVEEELEEVTTRLHSPPEKITDGTIFCLDSADFGSRKYDRFSVFEMELYAKSLEEDSYRDFELAIHRINWAIRLCNLQNSHQLKLCAIDVVFAFRSLFRKEPVDIGKITAKIQNSFFPTQEFSLRDLFRQAATTNAIVLETKFTHRERELQKEYVYREMLDNCRLIQKEEQLRLKELKNKNTYRRLDVFDVIIDENTEEQIEIGLGYSADREVVLDLINEIKNEFCNELDYNDEEFERLLRRSAPHLQHIWNEAQEEQENTIAETAFDELAPPDELHQDELMPPAIESIVIEAPPVVEESLQQSVLEDSRNDQRHSLQNYSVLTANVHNASYTDEDFYFNAENCIECILSPVSVFDDLLQNALKEYYFRQRLNHELIEILQFYLSQNSLQVADFLEDAKVPEFIYEGKPLLQPRLSGLQRLPLNFWPFEDEILGKPFYFARCDPLNRFILNPIYSGLNTAFWRILQIERLIKQFAEHQTRLASLGSRRGRIAEILCFKISERISSVLAGQLFYIKELLDSLLDESCGTFFAFMSRVYEVIGNCFQKTDSQRVYERDIKICGAIERFLITDDELMQAQIIVELKAFVLSG